MSLDTLKQKTEQLIEYGEQRNGYRTALSMLNISFRNLGSTGSLEYIPPYDYPKDNFDYFCQNCTNLKFIDSLYTAESTSFIMMVSGCVNLIAIYSPLDFSKTSSAGNLNSVFKVCESLVTVSFVEGSIPFSLSFAQSPLLSDESIQSIINGLATVETARTLTLHADVKAKLTESQIAQITSKNWNLA